MKLALPQTAALCLGALALLAASTVATAQIEQLDLRQMVQKTDNAVIGTITGSEVIRIDHPVDGPELYFTFISIEGRSLHDDTPLSVELAFPGGFVDEEHGVFNSEAPSADDIQVGNEVVAFYKWIDDMGGDLAADALYASHGGLFRTFEHKGKVVVQGRGQGYAVDTNIDSVSLRQRVAAERKSQNR
jgi:hypothetical protein